MIFIKNMPSIFCVLSNDGIHFAFSVERQKSMVIFVKSDYSREIDRIGSDNSRDHTNIWSSAFYPNANDNEFLFC